VGEGAGPSRGNAKSDAAQQSEFASHAAKIGQGIHKTSQKLLKLSQLAKRTSKFDDPAEEINELSGLIKKDIQALNMAIADLQNKMASSREASAQSMNHSHTVVLSLQSRLKDTTQEFKEVLTLRQENLRQNQGRRQLFSQASENGGLQSRPGVLCSASSG
jgi:syntaxin 5